MNSLRSGPRRAGLDAGLKGSGGSGLSFGRRRFDGYDLAQLLLRKREPRSKLVVQLGFAVKIDRGMQQ
jgi:hypothetical protein